jgi:hypothetical protein
VVLDTPCRAREHGITKHLQERSHGRLGPVPNSDRGCRLLHIGSGKPHELERRFAVREERGTATGADIVHTPLRVYYWHSKSIGWATNSELPATQRGRLKVRPAKGAA